MMSSGLTNKDVASPAEEEQNTPSSRLNKLRKINAVLMDRVERSMDQQGNAFSLFQTAIGLEAKVRSRTEELTSVLHRLERSNEALVVAKEDAERANLSKTRFLAAASHDLLQPLNAARLSISVLADMQASDEARALTGQIDQSLQTIEDLIETLLDISKLDAGVVKAEISKFPLDDVLSVVDASFAPQAAEKGLTLKVRRSGLLVRSDPMLLLRVLQNLVSNAVRYTDEGGVLLGVRRRGEQCFIDVIDTGSGISNAEQSTIFDEFYRGTAAAGGAHTGLGLGLSIVRRMVLALDHELALKSVLGRGSTFRLALPCMGESLETTGTAPRPDKPEAAAIEALILFFENDPVVRDATVRLLERWSYTPVTVRDLEDIGPALKRLPRIPDLVLADYHLDDGETGIAALEEVHRLTGRKIPSIVLTADHTPAVSAAVHDAGSELMYKPVKPAGLRALIAHLLSTSGASGG